MFNLIFRSLRRLGGTFAGMLTVADSNDTQSGFGDWNYRRDRFDDGLDAGGWYHEQD